MDSLSHTQQNRILDEFEDSEDASVVEALCHNDGGSLHRLGGVAEHPFGQQRFQSMPSITSGYDAGGLFSANSLGILFDPSVMAEVNGFHHQHQTPNCDPNSTFGGGEGLNGDDDCENLEGEEGHDHRSHSIDVLGIMGEAAALEGRIFSTPAAREAFMTAPLGQSIPMPGKPRSLSLPELAAPHLSMELRGGAAGDGGSNGHNLGSTPLSGDVSISSLFRNSELSAIREEEGVSPPPVDALSTPVPTKRPSTAGIPTSSLLEGYPGMENMVAIDDIQAYLDGMSATL